MTVLAKLVTYDLRAPGRNYESLIEEIKKYKWAKIAESCWLIVSNDPCVTIRDNLKTKMDKDDRIFVVKLADEAAWDNAICKDETLKTRIQNE